jgi:phospholipase D1/2
MELALKIAEKIRKRERFSVYIVIPMWPEGNPTSSAMQQILFWQVIILWASCYINNICMHLNILGQFLLQSQTIMMMYAIIGRELNSLGLNHEHPQDYLNFYCLGNRELSSNSQYGDHISENNPAVCRYLTYFWME